MNKLARVLLIDDSEADNFIHLRRLKKMDIAKEYFVVNNGQEAINYLREICSSGDYPRPELIFLDINMPIMNGWEFLDNYDCLEDNQRGAKIVTMLTSTTPGSADMETVMGYSCVDDYTVKPLTGERVKEIMEKHFPL